MPKRTLLVDADIVAYKFSASNEEVYYFDGKDQPPASHSDFEAAKDATEEHLVELRDKLAADDVVICLSDPTNRYFRHGICPTYKGNRKGARKPEHLTALKEWFKERYQTYQRPALEADDCMGILATHPSLIRGEKIIVSEDKDMQCIPALIFNPAKDEAPRKIGRLSADRFFLWQTIVGDPTDGYPGAPGIGPKSPEAAAVLASKTIEEAWGHVVAAFRRAGERGKLEGDPVAAALQQARLARILRASDWDFKEKRPILWSPPPAR